MFNVNFEIVSLQLIVLLKNPSVGIRVLFAVSKPSVRSSTFTLVYKLSALAISNAAGLIVIEVEAD